MHSFLFTAITSLVFVSSLMLHADAKELQTPHAQQDAQTILAEVTSYNSEEGQTDDTPDITASGTKVHQGTAACPYRYPFGTKIRIEGVTYICEDRMNKRYPDRFDIWMQDKQASKEWGIRTLEVTVMNDK